MFYTHILSTEIERCETEDCNRTISVISEQMHLTTILLLLF